MTSRGCVVLLLLLIVTGCGPGGGVSLNGSDADAASPVEDSSGDATEGAGAADTGPPHTTARATTPRDTSTGDTGDGGSDADVMPPPQPRDLQPCRNADCWQTMLAATRCSDASVDENYHTGKYNVHRWATTFYDAHYNIVDLRARAGQWEAVLLIARADGTVLFDGKVGQKAAGLNVQVISQSADRMRLRVDTDSDFSGAVFVTSRKTLQSGFTDRIPMAAEYALTVSSKCDNPPPACEVNSHVVAEPACGWLNHVGRKVVPRLAGTRSERLTTAARVAWWSLKEGVMFLQNPIVYSNCNFPSSGDMRIGPLQTCPSGQAWQVGLSAIQVPGRSLSELRRVSNTIYPNKSLQDVFRQTANEAGLSQSQTNQVVQSTGSLRRSWLLRDSAIAFTLQVDTVTRECIDDTRSWCFGTGWGATRKYAPDKAGAQQSIADIRGLFDVVAP